MVCSGAHLAAGDPTNGQKNPSRPPSDLELTVIHPFPNGNGRHARLTADVLIIYFGGSAFSWGQKDIFAVGAARETYLDALHSADAGDIRPLLRFARS